MKRLNILIVALLTCIFVFSSTVFATTYDNTNVSTLSKDIIDKANQGNADAQNQINIYFSNLMNAANNGDPVAINKLQNLDCFDEEKVKAVFGNVKIKPGETIKHYFDDGSAISVRNNSQVGTNGVIGIASTLLSAEKTWFVGIAYAKITTFVDLSSTRYVAHINSAWGVGLALASELSDVNTVIVVQDGNPSVVQSSAVWTIPTPLSTKTCLVRYNVDTAGILTETFSY
jgi:nucleoid DNA-binding protein